MDEHPYSDNDFKLMPDLNKYEFSINSNDMIDIKKTSMTNTNHFWKYNEDKILKQLEEYIAGTYSHHYVDRTGG